MQKGIIRKIISYGSLVFWSMCGGVVVKVVVDNKLNINQIVAMGLVSAFCGFAIGLQIKEKYKTSIITTNCIGFLIGVFVQIIAPFILELFFRLPVAG
jgi:hypothetical protein